MVYGNSPIPLPISTVLFEFKMISLKNGDIRWERTTNIFGPQQSTQYKELKEIPSLWVHLFIQSNSMECITNAEINISIWK